MAALRSILVLLSALALGTWAQSTCKAYGIDYSHGGVYEINASLNDYFSFFSVFQDCQPESITPVLISPDGNQYGCTPISTTPAGQQVKSECGIPYSAMTSGEWTIQLQGSQIAVQRVFTLIVGIPETVTVTATPTVIVGVTSTPDAITVTSTITQTQTLILQPSTTYVDCGGDTGGTTTITNTLAAPTSIITSTVVHTITDGQQTSYWTTTMTTTAICHLPSKLKREAELDERDLEAVAATTVTVTGSVTVTETHLTTVPPTTTTETLATTAEIVVTPPAITACNEGGPTATVTSFVQGGPAVTATQFETIESHLSGTVWVGQTEFFTSSNTASASACWRAGGWYGL